LLINLPLVVIGAFLIIYIGLGVVYFQKQGKFQNLGSQLSLQSAILKKPAPDIEKLRSQLKETESEYEIALTSFVDSNQKIDIYGVLVDLGRNSHAEVMSIEASSPITAKVGKVNETILPYSLVVRGNQSDILDYISRLIQDKQLTTRLELKSLNIKNGTLPDDSGILSLELYIHTSPEATSVTTGGLLLSGVKK
jgi:hypothetical protein